MKKLQADEILVSSKVSEQSKYDNIYNKYNNKGGGIYVSNIM